MEIQKKKKFEFWLLLADMWEYLENPSTQFQVKRPT